MLITRLLTVARIASIVGALVLAVAPAQAVDVVFQGQVYFDALSGQVPSFVKPDFVHQIGVTGGNPKSLVATQNFMNSPISGTEVAASPPVSMGIVALTEGYILSGGTGTLEPGGGFPGGATVNPPSTGGFPGTPVARSGTGFITAGPNAYGGTLRYFFTWASTVTLTLGGGQLLKGPFELLNQVGRTTTGVNTQFFNFLTPMGMPTGAPAPVRVSINNWKWTTGMVIARQTGGNNVTTLTGTGSDNRTANGLGTVSLVSPSLWSSHGLLNNQGSNVHHLRLIPEPGHMLLLGSGLLTLFAVHRVERRQVGRSAS